SSVPDPGKVATRTGALGIAILSARGLGQVGFARSSRITQPDCSFQPIEKAGLIETVWPFAPTVRDEKTLPGRSGMARRWPTGWTAALALGADGCGQPG